MPEPLRLRGIWPMLVTPFDAEGGVDEQSLGRLVDHVLAAGPAGIAAFGLASETHTLAEDERRRLAQFILARVGGRLPVLITVTAESTPLAVGLARHAEQHGAAVLMLAPPRVTRTGAAGLARHYSAVAAAVDLPIMIQDAPGYIGVGLGAGLIAEIVREHANVRSVKTEALPAAPAIAELRAQLGESVALFSGNGGLYLLDTFRGGAAGAIPGCDIPECFVAIYRAYDEGRIADAEVLFGRLLPLLVYQNQSLDLLIATTKALLAHRGIIANDSLRPPAPPMDRRGKQEIVALYERATAPQEQGKGA